MSTAGADGVEAAGRGVLLLGEDETAPAVDRAVGTQPA